MQYHALKTVLSSCSEDYVTFKKYYPKYFCKLPFDVLHMTEFLVRNFGMSVYPFNRPLLARSPIMIRVVWIPWQGSMNHPASFWNCYLKPNWWK